MRMRMVLDSLIPCGRPAFLIGKSRERKTALPDDRLQGAYPEFFVVWHGQGHRRAHRAQLDDHVAAALPDLVKAVALQNAANFRSGEDRHSRQR